MDGENKFVFNFNPPARRFSKKISKSIFHWNSGFILETMRDGLQT